MSICGFWVFHTIIFRVFANHSKSSTSKMVSPFKKASVYLFLDRVSCSPVHGRLTLRPHLPSAGTAGMCHHTQLCFRIFSKHGYHFMPTGLCCCIQKQWKVLYLLNIISLSFEPLQNLYKFFLLRFQNAVIWTNAYQELAQA